MIDILVPLARRQLIVIRHDSGQLGAAPMNMLEVILAGLLLYLWEHEPFRVSAGVGIVTPFRLQEAAIRRFVREVAPQAYRRSEKERQPLCATPERYQGRDLSRVVVSLVSSSNEPFREPSSMFTKNKLNVATSRAGSQQVVIGHRDLFSSKKLADLEGKINSLEDQDEASWALAKEFPLQYRRKLTEYVEGCARDPRCAVVDL